MPVIRVKCECGYIICATTQTECVRALIDHCEHKKCNAHEGKKL